MAFMPLSNNFNYNYECCFYISVPDMHVKKIVRSSSAALAREDATIKKTVQSYLKYVQSIGIEITDPIQVSVARRALNGRTTYGCFNYKAKEFDL